MNTLLTKNSRMPYHTKIDVVFQALGGRQNAFNWVLTGFVGHAVGKSWGTALPDFFDRKPRLIEGRELSKIVPEAVDLDKYNRARLEKKP